MKLPPINYRQTIYKVCIVGVALATLLGSLGVIPITVAGAVGTFLGVLGNALADRASSQLQEDGTLVLSGPVDKQVVDGINVLINSARSQVEGLDRVAEAAAQAAKVKDEVITAVQGAPVIGPLAKQVLDQINV